MSKDQRGGETLQQKILRADGQNALNRAKADPIVRPFLNTTFEERRARSLAALEACGYGPATTKTEK